MPIAFATAIDELFADAHLARDVVLRPMAAHLRWRAGSCADPMM